MTGQQLRTMSGCQNCELKNAPFGVLTSGGSIGCEFINCSIHDNGIDSYCHGLYIQGSSNLVDGCTIYRNSGYGVHLYNGYKADSVHHSIVRNNIIHDNATYGQYGTGIYTIGGNDIIYNNIIYHNNGGIQLQGTTAIGVKVYNNTVFGKHGSTREQSRDLCERSDQCDTSKQYRQRKSKQYQQHRGRGTTQDHNFTSNPGFVDAAGLDFRLQSTSAAINAGAALSEFSTDRDGMTRPQGSAWDIGAYESVSAPLPLPPTPSAPRSGSTGVSIAAHTTMGRFSWSHGISPTGLDKFNLLCKRLRSEQYHRNLSDHKPPCEQHNVLLACLFGKRKRLQPMVPDVEFHNFSEIVPEYSIVAQNPGFW